MSSSSNLLSARGSEWSRWDPHLHAPGTLLNNGFSRNWNGFLEKIETANPPISALGLTDYFCIRTYKEAREHHANGRMKGVQLLFPNVELRLDLKTEKSRPINIHLLFSPDDSNHVREIERTLSHLDCEFSDRRWHCTEQDLIQIGRLVNPEQKDETAALREGANQFKVTLSQLKELFRRDEWVRKNCLVAVAGNQNDGTAGLQNDTSFTLMRREIERFADIIFSATPNQRTFWLGKKAGHPREWIEERYGAIKPCLHGSDAHTEKNVGAPTEDRFCWIKGDISFESLRQAVLEPEDRVWIGASLPPHHAPQASIREVQINDAPWITSSALPLNSGLVAIIGARGSGKTALLDIIARGAGARAAGDGHASFLRRASDPVNLLGDATVALQWQDGSKSESALVPQQIEEGDGDVCYLSQQFVDRLCSSTGLANELRSEMERVIFEATERTDRLNTTSFRELLEVFVAPVQRRREDLERDIQSISTGIVKEEHLKARSPELKSELASVEKSLSQAKADLATLLPKGSEQRVAHLTVLEAAHAEVQSRIEGLKRRVHAIGELSSDVKRTRGTVENRRLAEMRQKFRSAELRDDEWNAFGLAFVGDVDQILSTARQAAEASIRLLTEGDPATSDFTAAPPSTWPLRKLLESCAETKAAVGIDADRQKRYDALKKSIGQMETQRRRLDDEIKNADGAESRRRSLLDERRGLYRDAIATFTEEEEILKRLYEPLRRELTNASGAVARLEFYIQRRVDIESWVRVAETQLLDLRNAGRFRGHGALRREADAALRPALARGTADEIASAMDTFRTQCSGDLLNAMPRLTRPEEKQEWIQSLASWLYATDHIQVEYGIRYNGTAIEQLSPGTRGIVLLLLYLAIDHHDRRPLLIDQPEENLDPKSVFEELVPHFREARKRRQVIIVTHNANLVVNTDADQVLVATAAPTSGDALPQLSYDAGGLENPRIRKAVCETLEGGERAFRDRERRYRLGSVELTAPPKVSQLASNNRSETPRVRLAKAPLQGPTLRHVPVYDLRAAAGGFGESQPPEVQSWTLVQTQRAIDSTMFVARVVGSSMETEIPDGSDCLFRFLGTDGASSALTLEGRRVIVELREGAEIDGGGRYTLKRWHVSKIGADGNVEVIELRSDNRSFKPIVIRMTGDQIRVVAEFLEVVNPLTSTYVPTPEPSVSDFGDTDGASR